MVLGLGSVLEASYLFYYTPKSRVHFYFGFTSTFWVDLRELYKGMFGRYLRGCLGLFYGCLGLFIACLKGCLGPFLRFVQGDIWKLFKGLFGAILWLLVAVYRLFKGLFRASFKFYLKGCLGSVYGLFGAGFIAYLRGYFRRFYGLFKGLFWTVLWFF